MLEALDLTRREGSRRLLDAVSLQIGPGDRIGIVGSSGSGKTLLLRAIALLDPVDEGNVHWRGEFVRDTVIPRFRSEVIYLAQRPALVDGTVESNLREPFTLAVHRERVFDRRRIESLLGRVGREVSFLRSDVVNLSGGEAQLVALLRTIQLDPYVLLLDEPTASLDLNTTQQVEALVERWREERSEERALVWVSHDESQVARVTQRVLTMNEGRLAD